MKKTSAVILIGSIVFLTTCIRDTYSPNACFQEDVLPIFISNCTFSECHNSKEKESGYDLTTYAGIMKGITAKHPLRSEIYNTIKSSNPSMPESPYSKLSKKDVYTIKAWIQMGAKNTSNCKGCDTINYTYSARVKPLIQTWCTGCHNSSNPGGGFDLTNYNGVVSSIANNKLLGSLKHLSGFSAMPKNASQLSLCDITAIQKWITAGYPNN
jgi:hypothetical protein